MRCAVCEHEVHRAPRAPISAEAEADLLQGNRMGAHAMVARMGSSRIVGRRPLVRLAPARAFNPTRHINFPVIGASFTTRRLVAGEMADHARPRCLGERAQPPRGTHCCVYTARKPAVGAARAPRVGSTWPAGCPPLGRPLVGSAPSAGCGGVCGASRRPPRPGRPHTGQTRRQRRGGGGVAALRCPGRAVGTVSPTCASSEENLV